MLETLLGIIRGNAPGQPPQHCLLLGTRGMGKPTTLWAIAHRINRDFELARQWQPVVFDEESRRVGDLADFWLEAIRQWEHAVQDTSDRAGALLAQAAPDIEDRATWGSLDHCSTPNGPSKTCPKSRSWPSVSRCLRLCGKNSATSRMVRGASQKVRASRLLLRPFRVN
jgi:hypothetical protein